MISYLLRTIVTSITNKTSLDRLYDNVKAFMLSAMASVRFKQDLFKSTFSGLEEDSS